MAKLESQSFLLAPPPHPGQIELEEEGRLPWLLADNLGGVGRHGAGRTGTISRNFYVEQKPGSFAIPTQSPITGTREWHKEQVLC